MEVYMGSLPHRVREVLKSLDLVVRTSADPLTDWRCFSENFGSGHLLRGCNVEYLRPNIHCLCRGPVVEHEIDCRGLSRFCFEWLACRRGSEWFWPRDKVENPFEFYTPAYKISVELGLGGTGKIYCKRDFNDYFLLHIDGDQLGKWMVKEQRRPSITR